MTPSLRLWRYHARTEPRPSMAVDVAVGRNEGQGSVIGAQVGTLQGGGGGESHVVVNIAQQLDNPPETMQEYLKSLWKNQLMGQRDQYLYRAQRETEEAVQAAALRQYQRRITRWLIGLTLILGVLALIMVIWIVQWVDRFGWLW